MNIQIGSFFFFVAVVISAWSWELSNYRPVKSDNGEFLCGMSPANETRNDIESKFQCMAVCAHVCPDPCKAVNYWQSSKLCEHFYYVPCSYEVQEGCINYQVTAVEFPILSKIISVLLRQ